MQKLFVFSLALIASLSVYSATITGTIKEKNGAALAFSSILNYVYSFAVSRNTLSGSLDQYGRKS